MCKYPDGKPYPETGLIEYTANNIQVWTLSDYPKIQILVGLETWFRPEWIASDTDLIE